MTQTETTDVYPILYSFRRCPYAMRARLALMVSGQVCELREVILKNKPQAMLDASAKATVPVLITLDGQVLDESLDIMLWALRQRDPEQWLMPGCSSLEAMLELIAHCDGAFKYHLDRYKYPGRYGIGDPETHRAAGACFLEKLARHLSATPYLFGNHAALADMAIVPFVRQFAHTDKLWFGAQPWPMLARWLAGIVDTKSYSHMMQKYPPWIEGTVGALFPGE